MAEWSPNAVGRLKELWVDHSATSVAAIMAAEGYGDFSRNAIIGKVHRLGLHTVRKSNPHPQTSRGCNAVKRGKRMKQPPVGSTAFKVIHAIKRMQKSPEIKPQPFVCQDAADIDPRHLSLLDLEAGDCRWPYGDGPFTFCGHPSSAGSSYCLAHLRLSIGPGTSAERKAVPIKKAAA